MSDPMVWTTEQILLLKPLPAPPPDATAIAAHWVAERRLRVTYHDVMREFNVARFTAMRRLREATERGLLVRYRARKPHTPDEFGAPARA